MTIEEIYRALPGKLMELQEAVSALGVTLDEDKPDEVALASLMSDAALAANGFLDEARQAGEEAANAASNRDLDRARRALVQCQDRFHRFTAHFFRELSSWTRIDDLRTIASERGRGWRQWADVVKQALEQCLTLIEDAREALFICWRELAECMGQRAISVHAVAVGSMKSRDEEQKAV